MGILKQGLFLKIINSYIFIYIKKNNYFLKRGYEKSLSFRSKTRPYGKLQFIFMRPIKKIVKKVNFGGEGDEARLK